MAQGNSNVSSQLISLTDDIIMLQRKGDWVNYTLSIPKTNIATISSAQLLFCGGSSIDTSTHMEFLSVFSKSNDTLTEVEIQFTGNYVSSGSLVLEPEFTAALLAPDSIVSIRTDGTENSWLVIEKLILDIAHDPQDIPLSARDRVPIPPKSRYRGSKEGGKFVTYAHEVAGACSHFLINKTEVPTWGGKDIDQAFSLMDLSIEFQHIRRILEYRRSLRES